MPAIQAVGEGHEVYIATDASGGVTIEAHDMAVSRAGRTAARLARESVSGGASAAHYVSELKDISGILVPTKHTVFGRQPDGSPVPTPLVVSIDIGDVEFS